MSYTFLPGSNSTFCSHLSKICPSYLDLHIRPFGREKCTGFCDQHLKGLCLYWCVEIRDEKSVEVPVHTICVVFIRCGVFQQQEGPALTFPAGFALGTKRTLSLDSCSGHITLWFHYEQIKILLLMSHAAKLRSARQSPKATLACWVSRLRCAGHSKIIHGLLQARHLEKGIWLYVSAEWAGGWTSTAGLWQHFAR